MIQTAEEAVTVIERLIKIAPGHAKLLAVGWDAALDHYRKAERKTRMGRMLIEAAQAMEKELIDDA